MSTTGRPQRKLRFVAKSYDVFRDAADGLDGLEGTRATTLLVRTPEEELKKRREKLVEFVKVNRYWKKVVLNFGVGHPRFTDACHMNKLDCAAAVIAAVDDIYRAPSSTTKRSNRDIALSITIRIESFAFMEPVAQLLREPIASLTRLEVDTRGIRHWGEESQHHVKEIGMLLSSITAQTNLKTVQLLGDIALKGAGVILRSLVPANAASRLEKLLYPREAFAALGEDIMLPSTSQLKHLDLHELDSCSMQKFMQGLSVNKSMCSLTIHIWNMDVSTMKVFAEYLKSERQLEDMTLYGSLVRDISDRFGNVVLPVLYSKPNPLTKLVLCFDRHHLALNHLEGILRQNCSLTCLRLGFEETPLDSLGDWLAQNKTLKRLEMNVYGRRPLEPLLRAFYAPEGRTTQSGLEELQIGGFVCADNTNLAQPLLASNLRALTVDTCYRLFASDRVVKLFCDGLQDRSCRLEKLYLSGDITPICPLFNMLVDSLCGIHSLTHLSCKSVQARPMEESVWAKIADGLKHNTSLEYLDLGWHGFIDVVNDDRIRSCITRNRAAKAAKSFRNGRLPMAALPNVLEAIQERSCEHQQQPEYPKDPFLAQAGCEKDTLFAVVLQSFFQTYPLVAVGENCRESLATKALTMRKRKHGSVGMPKNDD